MWKWRLGYKRNKIFTVLNHSKESSYQRVLIDGNWGIGKTKWVSEFKDAHSNVCYVSLFGKKDVDSIIQESQDPSASREVYHYISKAQLYKYEILWRLLHPQSIFTLL